MKCLAESTVDLRIAIVPNRTPGVAHLPVLSSIDRAEVTAKLLSSGLAFSESLPSQTMFELESRVHRSARPPRE